MTRAEKSPLPPPEAVKKIRPREIGGPGDARGRGKFTPPKQALISPWPTRYVSHGNRNDHPFVFIIVFASPPRRSAEFGEVLHGHVSPAGFWRREFAPSPGNDRGSRLPPSNFFTASLFLPGVKRDFGGCLSTSSGLSKNGRAWKTFVQIAALNSAVLSLRQFKEQSRRGPDSSLEAVDGQVFVGGVVVFVGVSVGD